MFEITADRHSVETYVDFRLWGVSVISDAVTITAAQKNLAAFVVTVFLVLGGFTTGLAQGTSALGVFLTAELNHQLPGGAVQLYHYTPPVGLTSEIGDLPSTYKYQGPCQPDRVLSARREIDKRLAARAPIPSPKVSLHMFQSVLLL